MQHKRQGIASWGLLSTAVLVLGAATLLSTLVVAGKKQSGTNVGADQEVIATNAIEKNTTLYPVTIVGASKPPGIATGQVDSQGKPVLANCTTCHSTREANLSTSSGSQLKDFHLGLNSNHGNLKCVSCHNSEDYSQLHLASGESLEFVESIKLCAQCHGPQYRDYQHGVHGGMTGHWDLTRGPRTRNHCLVCHDAHAPQYQPVMPVFRPLDLIPSKTHDSKHREEHK